ncbi:ATP-grasp fold amidoligase family protein [Qipengyuania sp. R86523]|uniref:ATP-grasp fold amidoligase family protein n=1 Tax=Qipengyuania sp. R86523 TaxID=3093862 RepID=UPI0037CA68B4
MDLRNLPSLPHWLIPSSKLRICLTYLWRHGRLPNLRNPKKFTELVQWRKLADRNPQMAPLISKVTAKTYASRLLGDEWIIPTIWTGSSLPSDPDWEFPIILKASHGCNQNIVCHNKSDYHRARKRACTWTSKAYGLWLDEWAYRQIPRGYLVEPYLGDETTLPVDYKIYVFAGTATFVQVHIDRGQRHRWILYNRQWQQLSQFGEIVTPPPTNLARMLSAAERMASAFDFARVDFYEIDGTPKFGEVTFYPGSGLDRFDPPELDLKIGALWLNARDSEFRSDEQSVEAA